MYYFDNEYLKQYLSMGKPVKVTVNYEVLTLTEPADVKNPKRGVGYDANGEASEFDYQAIEKIAVGQNIIDIEMLQKIMADEDTPAPETDKPAKAPPKEEPPPTDQEEPPLGDEEPPPEEDVPPQKRKPETASYDPYMLGRDILHEYRKQRNRLHL